jgi:hypothetical protein
MRNFKALDMALETGDLASAQSAFSAIQQNMPSAPNVSTQSQPTSDDAMGKAFQSLSDALGKGDLSGAQTAFSDVANIMKAGGHHHPKGDEGFGPDQDTDMADSSVSQGSTGTVLNAQA